MAFEHADFGNSVHFDSRLLGSVGSAPHIQTGPVAASIGGRPQLSVVPDPIDDELATEEDQWQERALCAQTDPEAFFPEKGGSTREAKRICQAARCAMRASNTPWPMTSASASGADCPSGSAGASSAASSSRRLVVVDRRVDHRRSTPR